MSPAELSPRVWDAPRPELPVLTLTMLPFEGEHVAPLQAVPLRLHRGARPRALRLLETARAGGARAPIQLLGALEDHEAAAVLAEEPHLFSATPDDTAALERLAARLGLALVSGLSAYAIRHPQCAASVLERVSSPRVAPAFALLLEHPASVEAAQGWMLADPDRAAVGLWPSALGSDEAMRGPAARALRLLAWLGRRDAVCGAAEAYGVAAHVPALLSDDRPHRPARLPVSLDGLPTLHDRDDRPLGDEASHTLVELLRATPRRPPCSALQRARASLRAVDVDRFVLALFDRFFASGERERDRWMMHAPSVLGGDGAVLGLIERLPRLAAITAEHASVVLGSLAAIATPLAVLELEALAREPQVSSLGGDLGSAIVEARVRSGWPRFGAGPEHVPDVLGGKRTLALRCGRRTLVARLSHGYEVRVCDDEGRLDALPTKDTDLGADEAALSLRVLARAAELAAPLLVERLQVAMTTRKRFRRPVFERMRRSATHAPLLASLLLRVVPRGVLVRLAEDGSLEDLEERAVALGEGESVVVAEPASLSDEEHERWARRFGDYEVIQPFAQLGRELSARVGRPRLDPV